MLKRFARAAAAASFSALLVIMDAPVAFLATAHAQEVPDLVVQACFEIESLKTATTPSSRAGSPIGLTQALSMYLFPNRYIDLNDTPATGKLGRPSDSPKASSSEPTETLIFASATKPNAQVQRLIGNGSDETEAEFLQDLYWQEVKFARDVRALKRAANVRECVEKAQQLGWTSQRLSELMSTRQNGKNLAAVRDSRFRRAWIESWSKAYPRARVIPAVNHKEILKSLEVSRDVNQRRHVVLILEADSKGRLYDSQSLAIPRFFFQNADLISRIESLTVFSCYPNRVLRHYEAQFEALAKHGITVFQPRLMGPLENLEVTPLGLFEVFAKLHSRRIQEIDLR